jgi:hypothetical protein
LAGDNGDAKNWLKEEKMDKCDCGSKRTRKRVIFKHQGFSFNFEPYCPMLVCPKCARQYALELFKKYSDELLIRKSTKKGENFKVNWQFYKNSNDVAQWEIIKLLVMLNLLSSDISGRWAIIGERMILNPGQGCTYFFTREQDAVSYARQEFGGTMYSWEIVKIVTSLKKATVLKKK